MRRGADVADVRHAGMLAKQEAAPRVLFQFQQFALEDGFSIRSEIRVGGGAGDRIGGCTSGRGRSAGAVGPAKASYTRCVPGRERKNPPSGLGHAEKIRRTFARSHANMRRCGRIREDSSAMSITSCSASGAGRRQEFLRGGRSSRPRPANSGSTMTQSIRGTFNQKAFEVSRHSMWHVVAPAEGQCAQ